MQKGLVYMLLLSLLTGCRIPEHNNLSKSEVFQYSVGEGYIPFSRIVSIQDIHIVEI